MSVVVRLARTGKRGKPMYRIVAVNKRQKRDSMPLEIIGTYIPHKENPTIHIDEKRISYWQSHGALLSSSLQKILPKKKA